MDDNTQQAQQPAADMPVTGSSMNDVAGMTPPPVPVMPEPAATMPSEPAAAPMGGQPTGEQMDDASYAEDILNEILDSLDRIEAKLDAMGKKQG